MVRDFKLASFVHGVDVFDGFGCVRCGVHDGGVV
jgi:hypothetical protein